MFFTPQIPCVAWKKNIKIAQHQSKLAKQNVSKYKYFILWEIVRQELQIKTQSDLPYTLYLADKILHGEPSYYAAMQGYIHLQHKTRLVRIIWTKLQIRLYINLHKKETRDIRPDYIRFYIPSSKLTKYALQVAILSCFSICPSNQPERKKIVSSTNTKNKI